MKDKTNKTAALRGGFLLCLAKLHSKIINRKPSKSLQDGLGIGKWPSVCFASIVGPSKAVSARSEPAILYSVVQNPDNCNVSPDSHIEPESAE